MRPPALRFVRPNRPHQLVGIESNAPQLSTRFRRLSSSELVDTSSQQKGQVMCSSVAGLRLRRKWPVSTRIIIENSHIQIVHYQIIAHNCEGSTLAIITYKLKFNCLPVECFYQKLQIERFAGRMDVKPRLSRTIFCNQLPTSKFLITRRLKVCVLLACASKCAI